MTAFAHLAGPFAQLSAYLPQDRLRALARGETLPDRTTGAALFADISGFTPLTEALRDSLGSRRGAEELTRHLDAVYTALITEVERYSGSVIGFAGDAITCWFDDAHTPAAPRATTCAFALQQAMRAFAAIALPNGATATLALKVAVATGSARRFAVGDPAIHYLDALAGATVARTATAEHLAQKGEVLLDEATVNALGAALTVREWRTDTESGERFAVTTQFVGDAIAPLFPESAPRLEASALRAWVPQTVYERESSGQGTFLTEFRPCLALFVRFAGIDYDADEAEVRLDAFIRQAQAIVARYGGTFLQLTIGDKGSYAYINLGALIAHEDDARRAVKIALELRAAASQLGYLAPLQIGLTQGTLRVGAYGGPTRRTYGAFGDEVNLAARLMQTAAPGEILLSGPVQKAVAAQFVFEPRSPLPVKGKAEPLPVFAVTGERQQRAIRLQEPQYALPMVGRQTELHTITEKMELALQGKAQIIGIVAEAGMGKSRLVAEVIRLARRKGFTGYGGACQSDGVNTPYLAWKAIWSAFFGVDPELPLRKQIRLLEGEIEDRAPERVNALPLLGPLLNLAIPDNDFTKPLEPKDRKGALHALLEDCLKATTKDEPLLLVIEDLHWIDGLSHDLLDELARATTAFPLCFVLAYRPPHAERARLVAPRLEALPHFTKIELSELSAAECEQAIRAKLAQLYPARGGAVPPVLIAKLMARAQGNPFYLEELLNFLHDRGLDPRDPADLNKIELPDSLHTLILSRIDMLAEREKTTLRVASIIGRLFRAQWLVGYYPALGTLPQVQADLQELHTLDITPLDTPEPELAYLFKHIVTHEVTYESLPFATRAQLHEQLAQYLETIASSVETIAHHYGQSHNRAKQREYFQKTGEAAQAAFANDTALEYYARLLPLLTEPAEQVDLHLQWGAVLERLGHYDEAETHYQDALAQSAQNGAHTANCQFALGKLCRQRGDYAPALKWLAQARTGWEVLQNQAGLGQALIETGSVFMRKGEYVAAQQHTEEGLTRARETGDQSGVALALTVLGNVALSQGNLATARVLYEESLALKREMSDKRGVSVSHNNLGIVALSQGDFATARVLYEMSLVLDREMGDKSGISLSLYNLGDMALRQGDYATARKLFNESLALCREMRDKRGICLSLNGLGIVASAQGEYAAAQALCEESLMLCREMRDKRGISMSLNGLGSVAANQGDYTAARALHEESLALNREMGDKNGITISLSNLGFVAVEQQDYIRARALYVESLTQAREMGNKLIVVVNLAGLAGVAVQVGSASAVKPERALHATRLAAAAEALLVAIQATMEPPERRNYDHAIAAARAVLGEEAFNAAWAEGQAMSLDDAIALALTP